VSPQQYCWGAGLSAPSPSTHNLTRFGLSTSIPHAKKQKVMNSDKLQKTIIYDGECPFCEVYTGAFVKLGVLGAEERMPFSALKNQEFISRMDVTRQGNEIPLVDLNGGETIYGLDAMLFLLAKKWKWIRTIFRFPPLYFFFRRFYALISYNRRIILAKKYSNLKCSCAPAFHLGYRIAFIFIAVFISFFFTWEFGKAFAQTIPVNIKNAAIKTEAICGTGWIVMIFLAVAFLKKNAIDYIGHLAVLEVIGVFILLPSIIIAPHIGFAGFILCVLNVLFSSGIMLRGHIRRIRALGVSQVWTSIWFVTLQATAIFWIIKFSLN
jgi:predicted DCC family thiol-disulfide oxidoreductase YuxK